MNDDTVPMTPEQQADERRLLDELRAAAEDEAAGRVIDLDEFDRQIRAAYGWEA